MLLAFPYGAAGDIAALPRLARAGASARAVLRAALDLALPRLCAVCREPVEGEGLCPACWSKLSFITPALLRAARHSVRLRSRPRHSLHGGDRRPARLPAGARRRALRRDLPRAGACAQIWRPARSRADDGPLDRASRPRASGGSRRAGAGAAALAAALGAAFQPVGRAGGDSRPKRAACRSPRARSSA